MRVCFVCLGNICRSPTAEGILRHLLKQAGRSDVTVESAGIINHHVGERPDPRTLAAAKRRGVALEARARHFVEAHLDDYDLVFALDETHLARLQEMSAGRPRRAKLRLLRELDPLAAGERNVPDPYYSDTQAFDDVYDMCLRACEALMLTL